ncbi:MAG: type 2 isopentenyl-diphosphate Delta-isomerase, partial [Candidatus Aenigmarchaeota archaeon ex4484_56]
MSISARKRQHLDICLKENIEDESYFGDVVLIHNALPNINFNEIDTKIDFLGKKLNMPLIISSMTGGTEEGEKINKLLAEVAEEKKIGFALGSQRAMFEDRSLEYTYHVRDVAPTTLILGNIGIANLDKYISIIDKKIEELKLDGTYIHLNPAQEIFQKEGDINWS